MAAKGIVFIEAHGKVKILMRAFHALSIDVDIQATKGHLFSGPENLTPLGINHHFQETIRNPINPAICQKISQCAGKYDFYLVATDPDHEGDVIAADIASLLSTSTLLRVRMHGLDTESVKRALKQAEKLNIQDSWPGKTRRILDRVIGASLSNRDYGISVGRVISGLLGTLKETPQPYGFALFRMDALDGGPPFEAHVPVTYENETTVKHMVKKAAETTLAAPASSTESIVIKPWNHGECVVECAEALDMPIREVAAGMQRLYERGLMSYSRSGAHAISMDALKCLEKIAGRNGIPDYDFSRVPIVTLDDVHESPRPLTEIDITMPLKLMDPDLAILTLITRNLVTAGAKPKRSKPVTSALPDWAKTLPWQRITTVRLPWKSRKKETGLHVYPRETSILRIITSNEMGRPSSQVNHALKFISKELVHPNLKLNFKGRQWLAVTPSILQQADTSRFIEENISQKAPMPPEMRVAWITEFLGEEIADRIQERIRVLNKQNGKMTNNAQDH